GMGVDLSGLSAGVRGPLDSPLPPPSKAPILNVRQRRQLRFSTQSDDPASGAPPMPFVSPLTIQPASRGPATPTYQRAPIGARYEQFKLQSAKAAPTNISAAKRDMRPKPYVLEPPSIAPVFPGNSRHA